MLESLSQWDISFPLFIISSSLSRLLKGRELLGHQELSGLTLILRGLKKVDILLLVPASVFSNRHSQAHNLVFVFFCCLLVAKKFGVNEFVNPKDYDIPVQQVTFFHLVYPTRLLPSVKNMGIMSH